MGTGWNLAKAVEDTFSVYVKSAVVENGVVTMTSKNISVGGRDSFTLILQYEFKKYSCNARLLGATVCKESTMYLVRRNGL